MQIKQSNGAHGLRKIETEATMLENGTPQFISLVKRGANRTPIRMAKSEENTMKGQNALDLGLIGRSLKGETVKPQLQAIIVAEGNAAALEASLKAAGLEAVSTKTEEGCDVIQLVETLSGNLTTMQISDKITVAISDVPDLKLETYPESTSFMENIEKASFFPNMNATMRVLDETVYNIMYSADTKSEAADNILNEFTAAGQYLSDMANRLPETVFKFEKVISDNDPFADAGAEEEEADTKAEKDKYKDKDKDNAKDKKDDGGDKGVDTKVSDGDDPRPKGDDDKDDDTDVDQKGEQADNGNAEVLKAIGAIGEQVQSLAKSVADVKGEVDTLKDGVQNTNEQLQDEVANLSQKADNALNAVRGTVVGGEPEDETSLTAEQQAQVSAVRKAEQQARDNGIEIC